MKPFGFEFNETKWFCNKIIKNFLASSFDSNNECQGFSMMMLEDVEIPPGLIPGMASGISIPSFL